jgi:hypothetical protein
MPDREAIRAMFGGRCAYCGKLLGAKWHADHVDSKRRGGDPVGPLYPACPRCNLHKGVWTIEEWRGEIAAQVKRLRRDSAAFRLAEDYGQVYETRSDVIFYFEVADEGKGER